MPIATQMTFTQLDVNGVRCQALFSSALQLGKAGLFDQAITEFAAAYADQNDRDYQALATAAATGRITAHRGL